MCHFRRTARQFIQKKHCVDCLFVLENYDDPKHSIVCINISIAGTHGMDIHPSRLIVSHNNRFLKGHSPVEKKHGFCCGLSKTLLTSAR